MSDKLVTVATFSTPVEAAIGRNALEADGVRAFLADNAIVGMAWYLGGAVGGIKLQVADEDAERAISIFEATDIVVITEDDWRSDETGEVFDAGDDDDVEDEPESATDQIVGRARNAAVLGLLFLPLQLYSLWLLMRVAVDTAPTTPRNRRHILTTLMLDLQIVIICTVFVVSMTSV
ncbi:MAG: hypothetical protein ABJZ55_12135 [Fuerstiella sp.]